VTRQQNLENRLADLKRFRERELVTSNPSRRYIDDLSVSITSLEAQLAVVSVA
jgi:hypothetical protein